MPKPAPNLDLLAIRLSQAFGLSPRECSDLVGMVDAGHASSCHKLRAMVECGARTPAGILRAADKAMAKDCSYRDISERAMVHEFERMTKGMTKDVLKEKGPRK